MAPVQTRLWCLIGLALFSASLAAEANQTLRFVHLIWRHGDRAPGGTFPTDTGNPESSWPQGWGELSTAGMQQHFNLGRFLRQRYSYGSYGNFLSTKYSASEIYVRSTSYNRTIMSALSNLAGMYYPPAEDQKWNPNIDWIPIPVHNRPREDDPMLWMDRPCPRVTDLYFNGVLQSAEAKSIQQQYADFLTFIEQKSGIPMRTLDDVWAVYDPLNCEAIHNDTHQLPSWVNETVLQTVLQLYDLSTKFYYSTLEIQRLRGGLLLGDILTRMQMKSNGTLDERLKMYIYSAHDTTVMALLENLGAYNNRSPPYAATIMLELVEENNQLLVQLLYNNDTTLGTPPYRLEIGGCPSPCTLEKFAARSISQIPDDWYAECGLTNPSSASSVPLALVIALGALAGVFFLSCLVFASLYFKTRTHLNREGLLS